MSTLIKSPPNLPDPPADPWLPQTAVIVDKTPEIEGVETFHLRFRDARFAAGYQFEPGQFNMLYLPGAGEMAISISGMRPDRNTYAHTIRYVGNVTRTLSRMEPGDTLGIRGPFGSSWPLAECIGRDVIVVAGGIGLAPLRPVITSIVAARRKFGRFHLLYGARSPDTLLYAPQYEAWTRRGCRVDVTVDRSGPDWTGNVGVVTLQLQRLRAFDPHNAVLLACGPEVMLKYTARTAIERGLRPEQIWISVERNMQCGVGLCGHCQLGPEFVCKDGPVFRYDRIARFLAVEGL